MSQSNYFHSQVSFKSCNALFPQRSTHVKMVLDLRWFSSAANRRGPVRVVWPGVAISLMFWKTEDSRRLGRPRSTRKDTTAVDLSIHSMKIGISSRS